MRRGARHATAAAVAVLALAGCSAEGPDGGTADPGEGDLVEVPGVLVDGDSAALSPDGSRIAVPCDGELCVWATADGSLEDRWDGGGVVAWSTTGLLATDRTDGGSVEVVLLDAGSGEEVGAATAHDADDVQDDPGGGLLDLAFAPDGETLAGVGADGVVRLWSVADPTDVVEVDPGGGRPVAVAFSPDGSSVAVASSDAPVAIHDTRSGDELGSLPGPPQGDVAWSPDGSSLATASFDLDAEAATTRWDARSFEVEATLPRAGHHLAFDPASDALVLSEKGETGVLLWSADDVRTLAGATDDPRAVMVSPDGARIYAVSPRDGVLAWDAAGGAVTTFDPPEED